MCPPVGTPVSQMCCHVADVHCDTLCGIKRSIVAYFGSVRPLFSEPDINGSQCLTQWHCWRLCIHSSLTRVPLSSFTSEACNNRWAVRGRRRRSGFSMHSATRRRLWWSVHLLGSIEHVDKRFISLPSPHLFVIDRCLQSSTERWMSAQMWVDCSVYCSMG